MSKPILCLDFDGVIHSYTSGWEGADVISDPPVPGALDFLCDADTAFTVAIYSSRSHQEGGIAAMQQYLRYHWRGLPHADVLDRIEWPTHKPSAMVTIDDRALTFTGEWPTIDDLHAFKPWNKKGGFEGFDAHERSAITSVIAGLDWVAPNRRAAVVAEIAARAGVKDQL